MLFYIIFIKNNKWHRNGYTMKANKKGSESKKARCLKLL